MLPEGYRKLDDYRLTRDVAISWTIIGNIAFLGVLALFQKLADFSLHFWDVNALKLSWFIILPAIILTAVTHEFIHGIGVKWFGGKPKYGVGIAFWFMPYFYCTADDYFLRDKFIVFAALPTIVLTLFGMLLIFFFPQFSSLFVAIFAFNFVGGIGDAWLIKNVLRYPKHVYVKDEKHGNIIYGTADDKPLLIKKKVNPVMAFINGFFVGAIYFAVFSVVLSVALMIAKVDHFVIGVNSKATIESLNFWDALLNPFIYERSIATNPFWTILIGLIFGVLRVLDLRKESKQETNSTA